MFKKQNFALKEQDQTNVWWGLFIWVSFKYLANPLAHWAYISDICFWRSNILSLEIPCWNDRNDFGSPFFLPQKIWEWQYLLSAFPFCLSQHNWLLWLLIKNSDTQHGTVEIPLESGRVGRKCQAHHILNLYKSPNLSKPQFLEGLCRLNCHVKKYCIGWLVPRRV